MKWNTENLLFIGCSVLTDDIVVYQSLCDSSKPHVVVDAKFAGQLVAGNFFETVSSFANHFPSASSL